MLITEFITRSRWILVSLLAFGHFTALAADVSSVTTGEESLSVQSPDKSIEVLIQSEGELVYSISVDGETILQDSRLGLRFRDGLTFGLESKLLKATRRHEDSTWEHRMGKRRFVHDRYNELVLELSDASIKDRVFQVTVRVFDDGVAFRYGISSDGGSQDFVLDQELTEFTFRTDYMSFAGEHSDEEYAEVRQKFRGPQEWEFRRRSLSEISAESVIGLPVLIETPAAWVAIAEADLLDWAGMWITSSRASGDQDAPDASKVNSSSHDRRANASPTANAGATLHPVKLNVALAPRPDGNGSVVCKLPHSSPWRVVMIGREPGRLIESEIIHNLSTPNKLADISWIQPGMMAWDHWWTTDTVMDTATIKSYIQFAADMGWEYQLIDWQWYGEPERPEADITSVIPALNMDEVLEFARQKDVRLWLWMHWTDVERNDAYKRAFPLYEKWGIAGVKIDFMDRDDQEMVNWYEKITAAAAEHHLMVNFHGAYKPTGFDRTYPNQITREGILANEYTKWSTLR